MSKLKRYATKTPAKVAAPVCDSPPTKPGKGSVRGSKRIVSAWSPRLLHSRFERLAGLRIDPRQREGSVLRAKVQTIPFGLAQLTAFRAGRAQQEQGEGLRVRRRVDQKIASSE